MGSESAPSFQVRAERREVAAGLHSAGLASKWQLLQETSDPAKYCENLGPIIGGRVSHNVKEQGSFCLPECYIGGSDLHMLH